MIRNRIGIVQKFRSATNNWLAYGDGQQRDDQLAFGGVGVFAGRRVDDQARGQVVGRHVPPGSPAALIRAGA